MTLLPTLVISVTQLLGAIVATGHGQELTWYTPARGVLSAGRRTSQRQGRDKLLASGLLWRGVHQPAPARR